MIEFVKSMQRRAGEFIYVGYRGDDWIVRFFYNKKENKWIAEIETGWGDLTKAENKSIADFLESRNDVLKRRGGLK